MKKATFWIWTFEYSNSLNPGQWSLESEMYDTRVEAREEKKFFLENCAPGEKTRNHKFHKVVLNLEKEPEKKGTKFPKQEEPYFPSGIVECTCEACGLIEPVEEEAIFWICDHCGKKNRTQDTTNGQEKITYAQHA